MLLRRILFSSIMALSAHAEETAAPPTISSPSPAPTPPSFETGTTQVAPFGTLFPSESPLALSSLFRWGPFQLRPSVTYRFTYGDGLQSRPGQESKTAIHEVIPNFLFELGDHWTLNYSPAFRFYTETNFQDSVDHSLNLSGATTYENWALGLSQSYAKSSSPLVETGGQTDQESFSTSFSAGCQLNSKMSLDLGLRQSLRFVDDSSPASASGNLSDSREWSTTDWLNYQFWPKFSAGLGVGFGYAQIGSDNVYEQANGRINWQVGNKLSLSLTGGIETRQFLASDQSDLFNPIFSASAFYQLFKVTSLSLSASRSVNTSYFQDQVTENTSVNLGLNQRLLGRLNLSLSGSFGTTDYKGDATAVTTNREDEFVHYSARLSLPFLKRATAAVFYSVSENTSGQSDFDYSSTQIGAELNYRF